MSKSIHIFKSFEEQEQFHKELMINSTPAERFRKLFLMQQWTKAFHPVKDKSRTITIRNGYTKS